MYRKQSLLVVSLFLLAGFGATLKTGPTVFQTAGVCMSCHNGLVTSAGEDVSFGTNWRSTMMANAARDPYWLAAVRREVTDFPMAQEAIENECSTCHMPMASYTEKSNGSTGQVFAHTTIGQGATDLDLLAQDGVSCTVCHAITEEGFGLESSFTGHFKIDSLPDGTSRVFGPFNVDTGRSSVMRSATDLLPIESKHIQASELCATCHTLYTNSIGSTGEVVGRLPEQVPYQEWKHSAYPGEASCQTCHMPVVGEEMPITSVLGIPRAGYSRHSFRGGNFFMLRILNRYRTELGVEALPAELDRAASETVKHLQTSAASLTLHASRTGNGELIAEIDIANLAGHKLPTAYPSRRAWIHFTVTDSDGRMVFESGALTRTGSIVGNDNDASSDTYESHYDEITAPEQVQIYEAILAGPDGAVTTGLLTATEYVKDNRLLPRGFNNATADSDIAVKGVAQADDDFVGGGDRVTYRVNVGSAGGPIKISAELMYQPIGFRWANNLEPYDTFETRRFSEYYTEMAAGSGVGLAWAESIID